MSNSSFNSNYISISGGTGGSNSTQDFRLTLASNTPVMTTEVLAATTLYLTPYTGNKIALYNGTAWELIESAQVSISLSSIAADTNYDVFAYNNSGTVTLELLAWNNSGAGTSARATALAYQDGVLVKAGATTRRYIGTIRGSASGQCQFSFGGLSSTATEAKLFLWNYNNRIRTRAFIGATTTSWTFTTSAANQYRAALNSSTFRVNFITGYSEDSVSSDYIMSVANPSSNTSAIIGIGLNSTTVAIIGSVSNTTGGSPNPITTITKVTRVVSSGFNYLQALEGGLQSGLTNSFYSSDGVGNIYQNGLHFEGLF